MNERRLLLPIAAWLLLTALAGCGGSAAPANACAPGTTHAGCSCSSRAPCAGGLVCRNDLCEADTGQNLTPPASPLCYTPCKGGYHQPDGTYVACDPDGLLAGCIDGATCKNGTCIPAAMAPPAGDGGASNDARAPMSAPADLGKCDTDNDCPLFQACLDHACYADCTGDSDCRGGRRCYMKTCRVPCTTAMSGAAATVCPAGEACTSKDGVSGFCLPTGTPPPPPATPDPRADDAVETDFTLSTNIVTFTPGRAAEDVTLTNGTKISRAVTITKASETEVKNDVPVITTDAPLPWLQMSAGGDAPSAVQQLNLTIPAGGSTTLHLAGAMNPAIARWEGQLAIASPGRPSRNLSLELDANPEGQWTGRATYFAQFGTRSLDAWAADKGDQTKLNLVGNALVRRWGAFRNGRVSWDEFKAALQATTTESWRWASVKQRCPSPDAPNPNAACYLYDNAAGLSVYSDFLPDSPVPTGETDFPVVFDLHQGTSATDWTGRVVSAEALQYPGDPAVTLSFEADPGACSGALCTTGLKSFDFDTWAGGRYVTTPDDANCFGSVAYAHATIPWLVPGFLAGTSADATGASYRHECRDTRLPYGDTPGESAFNGSLAGGNPIPDGTSRHRHISLIDGVMVNQDTMVLLFKESFPSFLGPTDTAGFQSYGTMMLTRSQAEPHAADYAGVSVTDMRPPNGVPGPACAPGLLAKLQPGLQLTTQNAASIAMAMVQGGLTAAPTTPVDPNQEIVHYYCAATNLFDGGPNDTGDAGGAKVPCPEGSAVRYFTLPPPPSVPRPFPLPPLLPSQTSQEEVAAMACQTASCDGAAAAGAAAGAAAAAAGLPDPTAASCDDPTDLRRGKTFYKSLPTITQVFSTIDAAQVTGFRYAEDFQSTSGAQVGFAPTVCLDGGTSTPFCYDPGAVQDLAARIDCAVDIATRFPDALAKYKTAPVQSVVKRALTKAFAYEEEIDANLPTPIVHRGFEELYADLLVMLGDEAFTKALSSRFDLASTNLATFEGSKFEPGGIDLDGTAGFQMYLLYQAAEYHQLALERFYGLAPRLWASVKDLPPGQSFVTPASAVSYFNRLVAASSKKTAVWSEVAKQYKAFNRPDLARLVIQRAYGAALLESSVLTRMMLGLVDVAGSTHAAEIQAAVEQAQAVSSSALLDMATAYRDISDDLTYFGFPADYVPFPVLTPFETDVFMKSMSLAQDKVDIAKEKEMAALADSRTFDTASQMFQSELATITRDYESQLADLCGTFSVTDANGGAHVYPAIKKYAELSEQTKNLGDPCGLVGNGALWTAGLTLQSDLAAVDALDKQHDNLLADAQDAESRTEAQCARIKSLADFKLQAADKVLTLQDTVNGLNTTIRVLQGMEQQAETFAQLQKCLVGPGGSDCPTAFMSATVYALVSSSINDAVTAADVATDGLQHEIQDIDNAVMVQDVLTECAAAEIDVQYTVRGLIRQADELRLEVAKALIQFKADAGAVTKDVNQALLLQQQENDSTQLAINVEAARNDPNVRVYRNIAVIEADRTFNDAVENAYRATRVYEYFTSQSYAKRGDLFLVRMISSGDHTLEAYLADLNEAYIEFQEQFGQADTRVVTLSLKDDLLAIPKLGDQGEALSLGARNDLFHQKLASPDMLDGNGYLTIPFQTTLDSVSPLTSNHKVAYVEAELVGSDIGDTLGRVYVRQKGTGSIRPLAGDKVYYSFPERTAVVDAFFNGTKFFGDDFYQNTRLRDRPFANTSWELVLNQKDEMINKDISLAGLSDIRLYLFYTDFTGKLIMTTSTKTLSLLSVTLLALAACSSKHAAKTCAVFLPDPAGDVGAGTCIPENATCGGGDNGIADLCKARNQACASMSGGARCGACLSGFALDGDRCTTQRTCASLGCAAQGRACTAETPTTHASCGDCLGGAMDVGGHCAHLTCDAAQSTASLTSACAALHRVCVVGTTDTSATCGACASGYSDASGTCVPASTCATIGCDGLHRGCTPAAGGVNAACGPCLPGFIAEGVTCVVDDAASCTAAGTSNIAASCAARHQACVPGATSGATCGACLDGYVADPDSGACLEKKACADLSCASDHRDCAETPTGHCTTCLTGFVDDGGTCRAPRPCFDAQKQPSGVTCLSDQECVPATESTDAYCRPGCGAGALWNGRQCAPCPRCDQPGEDGAWASATAGGVCICKTKPGYFYSVAGAMGAVACDADGDGWVRESGRSALESSDPNLALNARCALRTIDRFVYVDEAGQKKTSMLPAPLELYETDRNDDDDVLSATWALAGLPADRGTAPLGAAELNRLTKLCRSPAADYDDNGVPDVYEWGGAPPSPQLRPEQAAFNANAYFAELYWGAYEAGAAAGPGQYVIHEKSRGATATASSQRVPLGYKDADDPAWRTCPLRRDTGWNTTDPPIGTDFASASDPADTTFSGLNLESQFKCLVVDPQPPAGHPNGLPQAAITQAGYRTQLCEITTAATPSAGNASLTDFQCAQLDASMAKPGDVLWGAVPYLPNGPLPTDPPYVRGCMSACFAKLADCQAMFTGAGGKPPPAQCLADATKFGALASPTWCKLGEYCDTLDNNNDGRINEASALVDVGASCVVSGHTGACAAGKTACVGTSLSCQYATPPKTEDCNGVDDDCDGVVDNVAPGTLDFFTGHWSDECNTGLPGRCTLGRKACTNGRWVCNSAQQPAAQEICNNGIDDNCNGQVDESPEIPAGGDCVAPMLLFYADADHDGWPTNDTKCLCGPEEPYVIPKTVVFSPMTTLLDNSGNLRTDCCDTDANTHPDADFPDPNNAQNNVTQSRNACHSYDRNCDGIITKEFNADDSGCSTSISGCGAPSHTYQYATPDCGGSGSANNGCGGFTDGCPRHYDLTLYQQCK